MQGVSFLFAIQDKDYNFWQLDAMGNVMRSAKPYFLNFSPAGWDEISISNVRSKKYWGIDRTVTVPLSYVEDGATILKYIFYTLGIEEEVYLTLANQKLDYSAGVNYGYWYDLVFRGEIDFSTFNHAGARVTCSCLESGLPKYLKSNENTVYEFPMKVDEAIYVKMDGINLHNKVDNLVSNGFNQGTDANFDIGNHVLDILITQEDAPYIGGKKSVQRFKFGNNNTDLFNSGQWFINSTVNSTVNFNYDFYVTFNFPYSLVSLDPRAGYIIDVVSFLPNGGGGAFFAQNILLNIPTTDFNRFNNRTFHVVGSASVAVPAGGFVFLRGFCNISGATGAASLQVTYGSQDISFFNYSYIFRPATTYIRAFRLQYLFEQLIAKVTEGKYKAALSAFLFLHKDKVITCGNALRGLDDAIIKISFGNDYFQFLDCFSSVGISELNKIIDIDEKQNLIDVNDIIDLPETVFNSFKVTVAKEYLFNELEIGYPEIGTDIGVLNGKEETNCKFLFSLGVSKTPAKLDKVSKIKTGCYTIEKIRVDTLNKDTTDAKADNELFALHIENTLQPALGLIPAHYKLNRDINPGATGILEPASVFNLELSPKRNLKRNGPFLHSCLFLADNKTLGFKSADKNSNMVAAGIIEKALENIGGLGTRFFYPLILEFTIEAPENLLSLLDLNPKKIFRFPLDGILYTGILQKVGVSPSNNKEQQYQLLSTASNNIQKLIEYHG
jgi:hypothetical protein